MFPPSSTYLEQMSSDWKKAQGQVSRNNELCFWLLVDLSTSRPNEILTSGGAGLLLAQILPTNGKKERERERRATTPGFKQETKKAWQSMNDVVLMCRDPSADK